MKEQIKVGQITKFFYPVRGGQEIYIQELNECLEKNNIGYNVIQPHVAGVKPPQNIYFTRPIPLLYRLANLINIIKKDWFIFNIELLFSRKIVKSSNILICHYSFHLPIIKHHPKCIVLSHGVLWSEKENNFFNRYLKKQDLLLKRRKNITIVANDTDFLKRIGFKIQDNIKPYSEVERDVWYVPNCVDVKKYEQIDLERQKVIFLPRNIREDRGIHLAILAFAEFSKINKEFKMIIAGGPLSGKYYDYCKGLININNLSERITFVGFVDNISMREYYKSSMITLIPSIEKEGTSLSALESMASGTPVVATKIGGLADLPVLHAATNPLDLSNKIQEVLHNWYQYSVIQNKKVVSTFNKENWEKAWLEIIKAKMNN